MGRLPAGSSVPGGGGVGAGCGEQQAELGCSPWGAEPGSGAGPPGRAPYRAGRERCGVQGQLWDSGRTRAVTPSYGNEGNAYGTPPGGCSAGRAERRDDPGPPECPRISRSPSLRPARTPPKATREVTLKVGFPRQTPDRAPPSPRGPRLPWGSRVCHLGCVRTERRGGKRLKSPRASSPCPGRCSRPLPSRGLYAPRTVGGQVEKARPGSAAPPAPVAPARPARGAVTEAPFLQTGSFDTSTEPADLLSCGRGRVMPRPSLVGVF